ncbi:UNVERIFIED_CONTAM: translation termination factor GTPase eRF3 [Siphonaria sp. JEL0065]|nr:translation termination factor GTPase eRF3 [Siphonaria sp. JEL0065]
MADNNEEEQQQGQGQQGYSNNYNQGQYSNQYNQQYTNTQQQQSNFAYRPTTAEFVPSTGAQEFVPGGGYSQYQPQQQYGQYNQYQQGQYNYNSNYNNQQQRGGHQNYNNNNRTNQYNNQYNNQYSQQAYAAPQQQQAYTAPQQQQAYTAPQAYKAPTPAASGPAKSISIGGGPAKAISIGGAAPAKSISIGGAAPAKSISIGGGAAAAPAKSISIGGGPAKSISIGGAAKKEPEAKKESTPVSPAQPKASAKPAATPEKKATPTPVPKAEAPKAEAAVVAVTAAVAAVEIADNVDDTVVPVGDGEKLKEHLNIVFIGHVDAGKSTMGGHILFLTGMVDKRTLEKYEKEAKEAGRESWYLSWALDLNSEERAKGKTVEYGRGYFETEKRRYTILDAPGHKNFVPSMMEGAAQADVGVLVISARKGEFETGFEKGGQTREHAMLCKTVGVKRMILVVNKMDDPTVLWDKARYDECVSKILPFLKGVGYNVGVDLDVIPISGFTGANMKDRINKDVCNWFEGPSLLELLDGMSMGDRHIDGPLMMPISGKFKDMGTVVTGKIESGSIRKGQSVMIMPQKKVAEISAIWMEETESNTAISGDNVRIRLKNVEEEDVLPGFVMCNIKKPVHAVTTFEAQLAIVEYKSIMCAGYTAVCHAHTAIDEVILTDLLHKIDKKTGKKSVKPPQFVKQGDACIARIKLNQPMCLETFKEYPQLGRFTLRDEGKTIAIGKITKLVFDEPAAE